MPRSPLCPLRPPIPLAIEPAVFGRLPALDSQWSAKVEEFDIFDQVVSLEKINYHNDLSSLELTLSHDLEDLTTAFGNLHAVEQRLAGGTGVAGYTIDEFSGAYSARLGPGERLDLTYFLAVVGSCTWPNSSTCDSVTLFFQTRIGDPLDIVGSGAGFTIEAVTDVGPIPEPASLLLLGCGLLMLFARQRCNDIGLPEI